MIIQLQRNVTIGTDYSEVSAVAPGRYTSARIVCDGGVQSAEGGRLVLN